MRASGSFLAILTKPAESTDSRFDPLKRNPNVDSLEYRLSAIKDTGIKKAAEA